MTKKQLIKELEKTLEKYRVGKQIKGHDDKTIIVNPFIATAHIKKVLDKHKEQLKNLA